MFTAFILYQLFFELSIPFFKKLEIFKNFLILLVFIPIGIVVVPHEVGTTYLQIKSNTSILLYLNIAQIEKMCYNKLKEITRCV